MKRCPRCALTYSDATRFCPADAEALEDTGAKSLLDALDPPRRREPDEALATLRAVAEALARHVAAKGPLRPWHPSDLEASGAGGGERYTLTVDQEPPSAGSSRLEQVAPWAAPEVLQRSSCTEASWVWSLGVLAHELLRGERPFEASNPAALAVRLLLEGTPPLAESVPDAPEALRALVDRSLSVDAAKRPASVAEFVAALPESTAAKRSAAIARPGAAPVLAAAPAPSPVLASAPMSAPAPMPAARPPPAPAAAYDDIEAASGSGPSASMPAFAAPPPASAPQGFAPPSAMGAAYGPQGTERFDLPPPAPARRRGAGPWIAGAAVLFALVGTASLFMTRAGNPPPASAPIPTTDTQTESPVPTPGRPVGRPSTPVIAPRPTPPEQGTPTPVQQPASPAPPTPPPNTTVGPQRARRTPNGTAPGPFGEPNDVFGGLGATGRGQGLGSGSAPVPVESTPAAPASPPIPRPPSPPETARPPPPDDAWPYLLAAAGMWVLAGITVAFIYRRRSSAPPAQRPVRPPQPSVDPRPLPRPEVPPPQPIAVRDTSPALASTLRTPDPHAGSSTAAGSMRRCSRCGNAAPDEAMFCPLDGAPVEVAAVTGLGLPSPESAAVRPFQVGNYECFSRLGEGGMGVVYKARHTELDRLCAVKVLLPRGTLDERAVQLFRREAKLAASINHPNSVTIYDFGQVAGSLFYLAMELIEGRSLDAVIAGRPMSLAQVLPLMQQVCDGLDVAHAAGIVHRDLKPQNLMVCERPSRSAQVKIVDFGIARALLGEAGTNTLAGAVLGTPAYMAPEQARGDLDLDPRADVFALGVVVYEMLTGELPFAEQGTTVLQQVVHRATLAAPPMPVSQRVQGIPRSVDAVLARAMAPSVDQRPKGAMAFYDELRVAAAA